MKRLLTILVAVALVGICSAASAEQILPDEVLGELYAAGASYDTLINYLPTSKESAVAQQSNIAGIVAGSGVGGAYINNKNCASVSNIEGESAVAFQSNVGAIVGNEGNINGAYITNENSAVVVNSEYKDGRDPSVQGKSISASFPDGTADINEVTSTVSAIASQSNIGAIVSLGGSVSNAYITQKNCAFVTNIASSGKGNK